LKHSVEWWTYKNKAVKKFDDMLSCFDTDRAQCVTDGRTDIIVMSRVVKRLVFSRVRCWRHSYILRRSTYCEIQRSFLAKICLIIHHARTTAATNSSCVKLMLPPDDGRLHLQRVITEMIGPRAVTPDSAAVSSASSNENIYSAWHLPSISVFFSTYRRCTDRQVWLSLTSVDETQLWYNNMIEQQ